jgi:energy-coupling factor transport system ATP-binding protein
MGVETIALVEIESLTYTYPGAETPALEHIDLAVEPGESVLLVGPSGCGKSTLLRAIAALVPHFTGGTVAGVVRVAGHDTRHTRPADLAGTVGVVFQDPESQAVSASVASEVAFGLENLGVPPEHIGLQAEETMVALGVSELRDSWIGELSGGQLQRVVLAAVLAMRPEILVLDEPTSQLDPVAAEGLLAALRRLREEVGTTVFLAEHRLERCYHWADRVLVMEDGRIVKDGDPRSVARWALTEGSPFVPPVSRIFPDLAANGLPLTVREAREEVARRAPAGATAAAGASADHVSSATTAAPTTAPGRRAPLPSSSATPAVRIRGLAHTFPNGTEALRGVDLDVRPGEAIVIVGENGAGKSTLVRTLNGLIRPSRGTIDLCGLPIAKVPTEQLARTCAVLGQNPGDYLFKDTVADELRFTIDNLGLDDGDRRIEETLGALGIASLAESDPRSLSVGQRQRAALASLLVAEPRVVALDEPTRGMDYVDKDRLGEVIAQLTSAGTAVLVVTHDVEFAAAHAQRVVVLARGRVLADGPVAEVMDGALFLSTQAGRAMRGFAHGVVTVADARELLARWAK